jgi:phage terminase large subunit-like protein
LSLSTAEEIAGKSREDILATLDTMSEEDVKKLLYDWSFWARENQKLPHGEPGTIEEDWVIWLRLAGRGEGKTRTGAETVREWVGEPDDPPVRVALVGETGPDARDVLVEGESGIMATAPPWNKPLYQPGNRRLVWPNGSVGTTYSGKEPDQLRGPQHHYAWVDELAKYDYPQETWDNLEFGLRLGSKPRVIVSTTPRPIPIIKSLLKDPGVYVTRGSSYDNIANLPPKFIERVIQKYEGTRLGRQEVYAEVLTDFPGALWSLEMIERNRVAKMTVAVQRMVIGVDPAISSHDDSNESGIIVAALGSDGHAYIMKDLSMVGSPDQWARRTVGAFYDFQASRIVAEKNQGGDLVESVIRTIDQNVSYRGVSAAKHKGRRAEPVAALYEQNRVHHVGNYAKLEDQMLALTADEYLGGGSPDRADAMVWALTELMFGPKKWKTSRFNI